MVDEPQTPPAVTQGNDPTARTETGEIKDQQATPSTETKTLEPTKPESTDGTKTESKDGKKPEAPAGPPEKYDFKAPEGYEIDAKVVEEATPIFKELGLNQDQAQKLFDLYSKNAIATADAAFKQYEQTRTTWRDEIAKDPTLGDGKDNLKPEVKANISRAFEAVGDEKAISAFKEALDLTGAGDNPAVVHAMNVFGKLLSEGTLVRGAGPAKTGQAGPGTGPRSAANALYPNLPSSSAQS